MADIEESDSDVTEPAMHYHIVKMYKDKEVKIFQGCFFCQCVT